MTQFFKVLSHSEPIIINRQDGSTTQKSILHIQELGGPYANSYAATLLGDHPRFNAGDMVAVSLRFSTHEYQQTLYQDVQVTEIHKI